MFVRGLESDFLDTDAIVNAITMVVPAQEILVIKTIRHFSFIRFKSRAATETSIEVLKGKLLTYFMYFLITNDMGHSPCLIIRDPRQDQSRMSHHFFIVSEF